MCSAMNRALLWRYRPAICAVNVQALIFPLLRLRQLVGWSQTGGILIVKFLREILGRKSAKDVRRTGPKTILFSNSAKEGSKQHSLATTHNTDRMIRRRRQKDVLPLHPRLLYHIPTAEHHGTTPYPAVAMAGSRPVSSGCALSRIR
jgi:hypothetical protein